MRNKCVHPHKVLILLGLFLPLFGQTTRYAIILQDPPLAAGVSDARQFRAMAATPSARRIEAAQANVQAAAKARGVQVLHSTQTLLNAVYVKATREQAAALRSAPGVLSVVEVPRYKRHMTAALQLINAAGGWNVVGGQANAGAGSKIAILDTGIDITHAAFNDAGFTKPSGFPICDTAVNGCAYTNNKVIVARSYVQKLASGNGTPPDSRPDDLSPRDHVGHGTALAMIAAGVSHSSPIGQISGVAPKAFLGNYKIFGSPGVNDVFTNSVMADVLVTALEDALKDQMDVAVVALGGPGLWSPTNKGQDCGYTDANRPCDPWADAVQLATDKGLTVVASAGNDGDLGYTGFYPNLNSINSPGTASGAITVGSTTNSHDIYESGTATSGPGFNLKFTDGPRPASAITAPLRDASTLAGNTQGCQQFAANALAGAIALIQYGGSNDCSAYTKIQNAQTAGAVAVLLYRATSNNVFPLTGVTDTGIPAAIVGADAGAALKPLAGNNATLNPAFDKVVATTPDEIAYFSSQGPAIGTFAIKPELVAPGTGLYVATQTYDANGDMWSPTGYTVVQGTSFSSAMVAGAIAIARQRFPGATLSSGQLKSMVVNTANPANILDYDANNNKIAARVTAQGAGKLDVGAVAQTTITAVPSTISFGVVNPLPTAGVPVTIANLGTAPANLQFAVQQRDADTRASVRLSQASATIAPGASTTITVSLTGSVPSPGAYEGTITVSGGAIPIRIPYLYLIGTGVVDNLYTARNFDFVEAVNAPIELDFKAVDQYGVPVSGVTTAWQLSNCPAAGPGTQTCIDASAPNGPGASGTTDSLGFGYAGIITGSQLGEQAVGVTLGNAFSGTLNFYGRVFASPTVQSVVDAASLQAGKVAPGSYIAIKGSGLSPTTRVFSDFGGRLRLPLSLSDVSVSFDTPDGALSLPGRLHYVSPGQVNVQVPWELKGKTSVLMKVSIGAAQSAYNLTGMSNVQLNDYAPNFFEYPEGSRMLAVATDLNGQVLGSSNPAKRGQVIVLYANGLGPVDTPIPSGEAAPYPPPPIVKTINQPSISIGGTPVPGANIQFSGLTPGIVSLYQINLLVPENAPTGAQPLTISIGGVTSKQSTLVVQ